MLSKNKNGLYVYGDYIFSIFNVMFIDDTVEHWGVVMTGLFDQLVEWGHFETEKLAEAEIYRIIKLLSPTLYRASYSLVDGDLDDDVEEFFSGLFAYDPELIIQEIKSWDKELNLDVIETDVLEIENIGKWVIQVGIEQVDILKENK